MPVVAGYGWIKLSINHVGWWQKADACDATAAQSGIMKKSQGSL